LVSNVEGVGDDVVQKVLDAAIRGVGTKEGTQGLREEAAELTRVFAQVESAGEVRQSTVDEVTKIVAGATKIVRDGVEEVGGGQPQV
jgi:hypothetical protein